MEKQKQQTFNSGVVQIFRLENLAEKGNMPDEKLVLKQVLRYHERTVGYGRFYTAMQQNVKISKVIRCPKVEGLSEKDTDILIAVLVDGHQYKVAQMQYPEDIKPPVMDLTLERVKHDYEFHY